MDKTELVRRVSELMALADHDVMPGTDINYREIDVVAIERFGIARKHIFIECADYEKPVGVDKLQADMNKLRAAQQKYPHASHLMHVAANGYTQKAQGYALEHRIDAFSFDLLIGRLMNFDGYVASIESDPLRPVIFEEYQPTQIHTDGDKKDRSAALKYVKQWLGGEQSWLTVLGDYGVGKSWMLKRLLYELIDDYKKDPITRPVPLFVPLQRFTKSFDFESLVTTTLQSAGVTTVNYKAFEYLASVGRVVFLLDSFDEMAQSIRPQIIRENLATLLVGVSNGSKAVLTSRPTYFESRAERLIAVETDDGLRWEELDRVEEERRTEVARVISNRLSATTYARLNDLTKLQRMTLFDRVLKDKPAARQKLQELYDRFESLEGVSQRAVIARLLTTVAETLADGRSRATADQQELFPDDIGTLNQAKIFDIVILNLLNRDNAFGSLRASQRRTFLRSFAVRLQQPGRSLFAPPEEVRELVQSLFGAILARSDTPSTDLESYYRACRRHSGLTTQRQFLDTSGVIDSPVDENDLDSPVGFSHNSLREFLVADAIADHLVRGGVYDGLYTAQVTDAVAGFTVGLAEYNEELSARIRKVFEETDSGSVRQWLFKIIYGFIRNRSEHVSFLGKPANLQDVDLAGLDLSGLELTRGRFDGALLLESDFRSSDLRDASFKGAILERVQFDNAVLEGADFRDAEILSIYVNDTFTRGTTAVLEGKDALQWLFSSGALVANIDDLNPYLGRPWYVAAREVAISLSARLAGTHRKKGLSRGTKIRDRALATEFTEYLVKRGVLDVVILKARRGGDTVVRVNPDYRSLISELAEGGSIADEIKPFFDKFIKEERNRLVGAVSD
ncbi:pentapeptide repeat-containing protein [Amycolatopsis sp. NPDC021455]|uniref:NACHT domain-containing protein n=1 Tax=Amycolatopsis sp. NPDC021455 TaxID=3154901 RepID=UPI0033CE3989